MKDQGCLLVNPISQWVRVIGDPILHQPGIFFANNGSASEYAELNRQISIAKSLLIKTGGGGIAANQCAEIEKPYQFAIVGVFHESEAHISALKRRYPLVDFPQAIIMVNPVILAQSDIKQKFNHGCLSVPCTNRCEIPSPQEIMVEYLDPLAQMKLVTTVLKGKAAVALWHEMNHILDGKTYIDTVLSLLNEDDFSSFESLVLEEIQRLETNPVPVIRECTVPPFYFSATLDEGNQMHLNKDILCEVLQKMTFDTLKGISARILVHKEVLINEISDYVLPRGFP